MDFAIKPYKSLIEALKEQNYHFLTVEEYFNRFVSQSPSRKIDTQPTRPLAILRHDVDRKPENSLRMAKLEAELGVKATYYFRTIPKTFKPKIIKQIFDLGHEIGYHYENLCDAEVQKKKGKRKKNKDSDFNSDLFDLAIMDFERNLSKLQEIVPIKNIAMHGRPTSKMDSRKLWDKFDYRDYGITSEPYFDIDFSNVQYITDAGRSWDNEEINLRDKVDSPFPNNFKHTNDIINALKDNKLSNQIMINIHPEHWAASNFEWFWIWSVRKVKNSVKRLILNKK